MKRLLVLATLTVLSLAGCLASAEALVLCTNSSKILFARVACLASETLVDPGALGLVGAKGDKGDTGETGPAGPAGITRAAFRFADAGKLPVANTETLVLNAGVPSGVWVFVAKVENIGQTENFLGLDDNSVACFLRRGNGDLLGGASAIAYHDPGDAVATHNLVFTGGMVVAPDITATVQVWCKAADADTLYGPVTLMILEINQFF